MSVIVVGSDGSPGAEAAVQKVIELVPPAGSTVHVVTAYPGRSALERIGMTAKQEPVDLRGVAFDVLARDERRFQEAGFAVEKHTGEGDPAGVILDVAADRHADLIVVGASSSGGHRRFLLGTVAGKLAHHAPTSLLIVREE